MVVETVPFATESQKRKKKRRGRGKRQGPERPDEGGSLQISAGKS